MPYKLNDRTVHEGMYLRAKSVKGNGGKVFLVTPSYEFGDDAEARTKETLAGRSYCANCEGIGKQGLEVFIGGPYTNAEGKKHVTYYEGAYYVHDFIMFICPDCNGSGLFSRQAPRPDPVRL